jgi:hypothetical protein
MVVKRIGHKESDEQRGMLQTTSVGDSDSNHYLGPADEPDLRETVESYLTSDVIDLVGR